MFQNNAVRLATTKLASSPWLPASLILIGGVTIWQLWRRQALLQSKTNEMRNEMIGIKRQMAELKIESKGKGKAEAPLSSSLKNVSRFNPWASK